MLLRLLTKKLPSDDVVFSSKVTLLQPVMVAGNDGIPFRQNEFSEFDIAGSLSEFTSLDFSIISLQSVGALSKLTTTYMGTYHDMNVADKFESLIVDNNV